MTNLALICERTLPLWEGYFCLMAHCLNENRFHHTTEATFRNHMSAIIVIIATAISPGKDPEAFTLQGLEMMPDSKLGAAG
jgi:hypothetical protein